MVASLKTLWGQIERVGFRGETRPVFVYWTEACAYSCRRRSRKALLTTLMLLNAMAPAARIGLS